MEDWQPIETAPQKGPFLVWGGLIMTVGYNVLENWSKTPVKVERDSALFAVCDTANLLVWVEDPTHWRPLPEPPKI